MSDSGDWLSDDEYDARVLVEYLAFKVHQPAGAVDLGPPGSARRQGGYAAANPAAWQLVARDPAFARLHMTVARAKQLAGGAR